MARLFSPPQSRPILSLPLKVDSSTAARGLRQKLSLLDTILGAADKEQAPPKSVRVACFSPRAAFEGSPVRQRWRAFLSSRWLKHPADLALRGHVEENL
jgi:hypothetical protein